MQDPFQQKKESILKEIGETTLGTPDASPKGSIDVFCIPIINVINSHKDMVTTSSCSGRVSVFLEGVKEINDNETKIGAKGNQGHWLFVTHDPKDLDNWHKDQDFDFNLDINQGNLSLNTRYILYKFEPLILHVKCRDLHSANALFSIAMNCGFRESGIGSNNVVAIRISIKLDVPIGYLDNEGKHRIFVTKQYLDVITKLSHDRFAENFKRMNILKEAIESSSFYIGEVSEKKETKEERRQRKMQEGLARREDVRKLKLKLKEEKEAEKLKGNTDK